MNGPRAKCPGPTHRRWATLAGLAVVLAAGACDARPAGQRQALGRTYFDSTGAYVHAGVSTRMTADIEPLRLSTLRGDTTSGAYHLYAMRCGACHLAPDPLMKTDEQWAFLIGRMQTKTATAGLIPMSDAEADTVLHFLRTHARR